MNWWNFRQTDTFCNYYYCTQVATYEFTPGYSGKVGTGIEITKQVYIDIGFGWSFTGKGNFFRRTRWGVGPLIGMIVRR